MAIVVAAVLVLLTLGTAEAHAARPKLTGIVWTDADRDGVRDTDEAGRGGVRVELLFGATRKSRPTIARSTETDAAGAFKARIRSGGFYRARVLLPGSTEGFAPADQGGDDRVDSDVAVSGRGLGMTPTVKLKRGKPSRQFDAGLMPPAVVQPDPTTPPGSRHAARSGDRDRRLRVA